VPAGDVGFVSSVAEGMSMLVESLGWREGDEVLIDADEYPSVAAPLAQRGVMLRFAPMPDPDAVAAAVTPRTRMIAVSAVSFLNAARYDLAALRAVADRAGALLAVDFTQGAGWMPIRAEVADFAFSATTMAVGATGTAIACWNRARQPAGNRARRGGIRSPRWGGRTGRGGRSCWPMRAVHAGNPSIRLYILEARSAIWGVSAPRRSSGMCRR